MDFCIISWSGVHKARHNYKCAICRGIIPQGVVYRSFVMSNDRSDPKHGAYRIQHHLDCAAPWYQPTDVNRLQNVGRIPRMMPPPEEANPVLQDLPRMDIYYRSPSAGEISWRLTPDLSSRIMEMPDIESRAAVIFELEMAMATTAEALVSCASHLRRSRELGHLLYDVQIKAEHHPILEDWGIEVPDIEDL